MKKESYIEKIFREHEERYCAKNGRKKFLKKMPKMFVCYIIALILGLLASILIIVLGIQDIKFWYFEPESLIISGAISIPVVIMAFFLIPPYWRLVKKCKKELKITEKMD